MSGGWSVLLAGAGDRRGEENRPAVNWERDSVWLRRVVWGRKQINVGAGSWFLKEEH